jgi:hypothetical protein
MNIEDKIKRGWESDASRDDIWFAWYPVQLGALGTGGWAWLRKVWRNKCCGSTIYQVITKEG